MIKIYDYIELFGDENYSKFISIEDFCQLLNTLPNVEQRSSASFIWSIGEFGVRIQGIHCDSNGNYVFNDDSRFEKINLIDINLPQGSESIYHKQIQAFILDLGSKIGWDIDCRE
ncbi:MAG: hypothetical protein ACO1N0_01650 [Fluviicola sp.]